MMGVVVLAPINDSVLYFTWAIVSPGSDYTTYVCLCHLELQRSTEQLWLF